MDRPLVSHRATAEIVTGRIPARDVVAAVVSGVRRVDRSTSTHEDTPMNMPHGFDREKMSAAGAPSLDEIFIRSVARKPDELGFVDPADKLRVTGQMPRRLTFAEADAAVSALAAHFVGSGLPVSSIVALQLPNTVELMIAAL